MTVFPSDISSEFQQQVTFQLWNCKSLKLVVTQYPIQKGVTETVMDPDGLKKMLSPRDSEDHHGDNRKDSNLALFTRRMSAIILGDNGEINFISIAYECKTMV